MSDDLLFWEQPETVERFATREPDVRLLARLEECSEPTRIRALDLGCAGERNIARTALELAGL